MVGGQHHAPAALLPGKIHVTHSAQQGTGAENLAPMGIDSWTVHPVASFYTDWAIPAHQRGLLIKSHRFNVTWRVDTSNTQTRN